MAKDLNSWLARDGDRWLAGEGKDASHQSAPGYTQALLPLEALWPPVRAQPRRCWHGCENRALCALLLEMRGPAALPVCWSLKSSAQELLERATLACP